MISFIGIVSLPILVLSIVFIFFHAKFIRLYNDFNNRQNHLNELMHHKHELSLFFSQELLHGFEFSEQDGEELSNITEEIEIAQHMYYQSKDDFDKFINSFPGKYFATFLAGRSSKQ